MVLFHSWCFLLLLSVTVFSCFQAVDRERLKHFDSNNNYYFKLFPVRKQVWDIIAVKIWLSFSSSRNSSWFCEGVCLFVYVLLFYSGVCIFRSLVVTEHLAGSQRWSAVCWRSRSPSFQYSSSIRSAVDSHTHTYACLQIGWLHPCMVMHACRTCTCIHTCVKTATDNFPDMNAH